MNEQKTYDVFAVQDFTHFVIGQRVDGELISIARTATGARFIAQAT